MKNRDLYMAQLLDFKDKKLIKVITGMRRSGKSTLLDLFKNNLIESGVTDSRIIYMNFESLQYDDIKNYKLLYKYIMDRIDKNNRTYLLLDEIQQVEGWEKCVNSLMVDCDVDIYLTGSNAYLLSSELSTLLSGRYIEIKMLPLSFKEFLDFNDFADNVSIDDRFNEYLKYGSLPAISELNKSEITINTFLSGVYNTVILKDVVARNQIKDITLLENVVKFVVDNVGNIISPKKISDFLNSDGRKTTSETIDNYLKMLENAFIIYRAKRFDLKGKQYLKTLNKYYVVDTGIRNALLGYRDVDYGHVLENIIYFELLRRKYDVSIGKYNDFEIDFVVGTPTERKYYQVSASIMDAATEQRELRPLEAIDDNYEKTILTMDRSFIKNKKGIKIVNILDFLLEPYE